MNKIGTPVGASSMPFQDAHAHSQQTELRAKSVDGDRRLFYFFHVQKTGGRTIQKHLIKTYGKDGVVIPMKKKSFISDIFLRKKFTVPAGFDNKTIVGHFASLSLVCGRERKYHKSCFWRHPASWYISLYNYRHRRNSHRIKRKFSFGDFYRSMLRNPMTEELLLYCADVSAWSYFFMSDKRKFDLACATIERFDRFHDIAKVDDFLDFVGYQNGQKPKDYNRSSKAENTLQYLDEATIADIERQNAVDYFLHKISVGENIQLVRDEAAGALKHAFEPRDIVHLFSLPYYRFKTWVVPFV